MAVAASQSAPASSLWEALLSEYARGAGCLVELSAPLHAGAQLSAAVDWLKAAQSDRSWVAWIQGEQSSFYPPDLAAAGVDLERLLVARLPESGRAREEDAHARLKAAEILVRSGAWPLIVVDLEGMTPRSLAWQGRLQRLLERHRTTLLVLRRAAAEEASLGPFVALRLELRRAETQETPMGFSWQVLRHKRPSFPLSFAPHFEARNAPAELCLPWHPSLPKEGEALETKASAPPALALFREGLGGGR